MKTTRPPASAAALCAAALLLVLPDAVHAQSSRARSAPAQSSQVQFPQGQTAQRQPVAEPVAPSPAQDPKKDWDIRLGVGALYQPAYEGSDEYKIRALPLPFISYRDVVFLRGLTLGANAFTVQGARPGDKLQLGPLVRYQFARDADDSDDLRGMGDVDGAVELGGFITYGIGPWSTGLTVFRDVSDSHDGLTAKLAAGHRLPLGPQLMLRSELSTTWADDNYTRTYFGVTAAQSARSGMRQYRPEGGFKDAGLTVDLDYSLTQNWGVTGRAGYKRMLGDAADSPLVADRGDANQLSTGVFVNYRF